MAAQFCNCVFSVNRSTFLFGFATGSTPYGCYQKLIEYYKSGDISFKYVKTFNMDEYVGKMSVMKNVFICTKTFKLGPFGI